IYDSGLKVPLMVRVPPKWRAHANAASDAVKAGTASTDLVSFIDFAPTMLSLCNVPVPKHMQGQAFLGPQKAKPRDYIYAARDRVDEAYDIIRAVRDKRYKYIRNFMHHLPRSLDVHYMNQMPTMQDMRRLFAEGKLKGPQLQYFEQPKPVEELYDTQADPHEVNNLALDPKHEARVARMRGKLREWMKEVGDFGLLPECEFDALKHPPGANETVSAPGVTPKGDTVELTCTTPGASIAYRLDKVAAEAPPSAKGAGESLVLPAATATVHGKGLRQAPTGISSWRDTKIWLSWDIDVPKAGRLPVYVVWSCGGNARSKYTLTVGDQTLKGSSDPTGGWDKIASVKLGDVDIKKPGKITVTLKPVVKASHFQMDLRSIVIGGAMPKGAPPLAKSGNGGSDWLVYGNPITLAEGQNISVRACRIGFKDSPTVAYRQGGAAIAAEPANATPHWRDVVDKSGVIDRLLDIKQLDGQGEKAIPAYVAALSGKTRDEWGAVRYWAVVGLHRNVPEAAAKKHIGLVRAALKDESFAVRIAAAQALCDWGEEKIGLPVLIEGMKGPGQSAALLAATALGQIGEKARPAIPVLQKGKGGYVGNVCKYALMRLGKKP
ncbi:HEAT repeat domain-containing protein, partial [bacterium]|nr:HEAT repeat domain-containing protein [bacterium]